MSCRVGKGQLANLQLQQARKGHPYICICSRVRLWLWLLAMQWLMKRPQELLRLLLLRGGLWAADLRMTLLWQHGGRDGLADSATGEGGCYGFPPIGTAAHRITQAAHRASPPALQVLLPPLLLLRQGARGLPSFPGAPFHSTVPGCCYRCICGCWLDLRQKAGPGELLHCQLATGRSRNCRRAALQPRLCIEGIAIAAATHDHGREISAAADPSVTL